MYEFFDHTADLGLRVVADDVNALFRDAAKALFSAIVDDPGTIESQVEIAVTIEGSDLAFLLFDWLKDLLTRFDADGMLFGQFDVIVRHDGLTATARGETFDPTRHALSREVKAITYHELKVERADGGWLAEVIVDI